MNYSYTATGGISVFGGASVKVDFFLLHQVRRRGGCLQSTGRPEQGEIGAGRD